MSKALKNKVKLNDVVSVKDFGAVGDGVADDTAAIQAAATAAVSGCLYFPQGTYKTTSTLYMGYQSKWVGDQSVAGGSEIQYFGADATDAIHSYLPDVDNKSRMWIENMRVTDKRTSPTSGWGIRWYNVYNKTVVRDCFVGDFPSGQIGIYGTSGATDCIEIIGNWVAGAYVGTYGIYVYRAGNNVTIDRVYADIDNGVAVYVDSTSLDSTTVSITNVKHEGVYAAYDVAYATVQLSAAYYGNVNISNIVQSTVSGTGVGCDVVQFLSTAVGRGVLSSITGARQQVQGAAPYTVNLLGARARTYNGHVETMILGKNGGATNFIGISDATPEAAYYGSPGDICTRLDNSGGAAGIYTKATGVNTNTGWRRVPYIIETSVVVDIPSIANAASYSFDATATGINSGDYVLISCQSATVLQYTGQGLGADQVKIVVSNLSGGAVDPASQTLKIMGIRQ